METTQNYQLKITLRDYKPPIWRRIIVPANTLLSDLHNIIQIVMGWENAHLHHFYKEMPRGVYGQMQFYSPKYDFDEFWDSGMNIDYKGIAIDKLLGAEGEKIVYEYDFGDSWYHDILLEKILPPDEKQETPLCVKGKNACPIEDSGGVWGYAAMLEILKDPSHEDHEGLGEWLGLEPDETYDPAYFNMEEVNESLRRLFKSKRRTKKLI